MAWVSCTVKIYNTQSLLITTSASMSNTKTIWNLLSDSNLVSAWITEISATIWWAALSHSETISSALTVESSSWDIVYMAYIYSPVEAITGFYLDWTEYKFKWWWTSSEQNLFIITEDIVTVSTSEDTWVAPYNTSYKYTNFDIDANACIERKEWAIYTFVVDTEMAVASAYRNVRVRIWNWAYIPVMWTTAAIAGNSYFAKTAIRQFQYTTKYESGWALHVFTDSNTTYKAMTEAQATAWTATTALTISPSILKWAITTHAPVKSVNWATWAVTVQPTLVSWTNIKTINNESLLGSGNITISSPDMSNYLAKDNTTAFTPTWDYQPATKKYVDDNAGTEYNAWQWISIWEQQANARKWPSPDWFHVPSKTEWEWIRTIMQWLSLHTWPGWRINLHIPLAGYRTFSSGGIATQGSTGYYWSSSNSGADNPKYARSMYLNSSNAVASYSIASAFGLSIRCFKDSFEKPTSSRTVIQWTLWWAWIFRNQTDWLISITSDWTTWYTMQDKNLWATTVYNDWDTLSEANCWKYYQWWNNYWFAWIWWSEPRKSSTKVDTSTYWPTNPYSSDTFIVWGEGWSSVYNGDLRWDTTWTITIENVITNTGVLSVNGQTWNVIVQSWSEASWVTTTQPSNPVAWSTYYDTTSLAVKVYDWTQWNELWSWWWGGWLWLEYMSKVTLNWSWDWDHWLNTGVWSLAYDAYVVCLTNSTCRFILWVELWDYNYPRAATNDIKNWIMQVSWDSKWLRAWEKLFIYDYYWSWAVYNFYIYKFTRPS